MQANNPRELFMIDKDNVTENRDFSSLAALAAITKILVLKIEYFLLIGEMLVEAARKSSSESKSHV